MKKSTVKLLSGLIFILVSICFRCSVKAPEVNITGEKTALENQVIGTYQQIEEDVWTVTSVRSANTTGQPAMSAEKKRVLEAVQGRKFNKDDIDEFLKMELVGENNRGLIEIRDQERLNNDAELNNRVAQIVASENEYRKIIMDRIILLNEQAANAGEENVARIFSKMNQDSAMPGTWIQSESGEWLKKPSEK